MTHFEQLRIEPFEPTFNTVDTIEEAADYINKPHEDYPDRVDNTIKAMNDYLTILETSYKPKHSSDVLRFLHKTMFSDKYFAGAWRNVNVSVGRHVAPHYELVPKLMEELEKVYFDSIIDIKTLVDWYTDFQTIHPFQDGNGRVGGVIVACYANKFFLEHGYLAPKQ